MNLFKDISKILTAYFITPILEQVLMAASDPWKILVKNIIFSNVMCS